MGARLRSILHWTGKNITWLLLAVSVVFFGLTWMEMGQSSDISKAAASVEKRLERLEKRMDRYAEKVLDMPASQWADIGKVPDYMVIYKYVRDTLHSWINHFPLRNDEIIDGDRFGVRYNRLSRVQTLFMPLLSGVGDTPVYLNMGSQWYLVRSYEKGKVKLICGILVKGDESRILSSFPDVNPKLKLPDNMTIYPVASADGRTVSLHGTPVFNLAYRPGAFPEDGHVHSPFKWITVFLALASVFSYYAGRRNIFTFLLFMGAVAVSAVLTFNWAADMRNYSGLFSPVVYADSSLHASLGSLLLNNLYVFIVALAVFVSRKRLMLWYSKHNRLCRLSYIAVLAVFAVSLVLYIHFSIKSVVFNSSIVLELFRLDELSAYSILVYFSYLMLFMSLLFMIQLFLPLVTGNRLTIFNVRFILRYSLCISLYFMAAITAFSHAKEISMARAWSNKLAVERDLSTELLLRMVEDRIAQDRFIHLLTGISNGSMMIAEQLGESYFSSLSTGYDITVTVCGDGDRLLLDNGRSETDCFSYFRSLLAKGVPLHQDSHFFYINDQSGKIRYLGVFVYKVSDSSPRRLYIEIDSRLMKEQRGYSDIFPETDGLGFNIPSDYSYAKYISGALVFYRGVYNFPVSVEPEFTEKFPEGFSHNRMNKNIVFVNKLSSGDVIMITRERRTVFPYLVSYSYLVLLTLPFLLLLLLWKPRHSSIPLKMNTFRAKIMVLLLGTISGTVLILTVCMVLFYAGRNARGRSDQMGEKLHTVQSMFLDVSRNASNIDMLMNGDVKNSMDKIAAYTHTDINLYDTRGHLVRSTRNELYFLTLAGSKIDPHAFYSIVYEHRKSFFNKEKIAGKSFYSLYAPVINNAGELIAIINIPYLEQTETFRKDLISTSAAIVNIFVLIIIVVLIIGAALTTSLFRPLLKLYERMENTDLFKSPEKIDYDNNDEVAYIVSAYNRMIDNMQDSTRRFALSEREQAWRDMARQIAHEIKNPLTPMRLNIQYLLKMKNAGVPDLDEKLEKICNSLLEQIDVLADTATEFSSFARFNAEESTDIDLDAAIREQVVLFSGYEGIDIEYRRAGEMVGETYHVYAPKSQIVRLFVNLITNAVQAFEPVMPGEGQRKKIYVTLTKFTADSDSVWGTVGVKYVRVDVEDSGPGVPEENRSKLFTPKFTTKSSGSGLGLAICRSIVEQVGGTIMYFTSEELGGADFRVIIPEIVTSA